MYKPRDWKMKKVVSMCLSLLMALIMLPVSALAITQVETYYPEGTEAIALYENIWDFSGTCCTNNFANEYQRSYYTLNEARTMLQQGDATGFVRTYRPDGGPITTQLSREEAQVVFGHPTPYGIQPINNFTYTVRPILNGHLPCDTSIVIVLLGDGFTAGNNPAKSEIGQTPVQKLFCVVRMTLHIV